LGNAVPVLGVKPKTGVVRKLVILKVINYLCSARFFKRPRRELSIDVAEHWFISKNYQLTHHHRFGFTPKTDIKGWHSIAPKTTSANAASASP